MHIIHSINDFLFELFPKAKEAANNLDVLKREIEKFYTVGPYKPTMTIIHGIIDITIEGELIEKHNSRFRKVLDLCDALCYEEAKQQINQLIREAPHISEYHRVLGQILSEQGEQDDALNSLIDALRWDPKNEWALIMTGNILARCQHDIDAAMKYYECAEQHKPDDYVSLTLIAINLIRNGKSETARQYLDKAFEINPAYPNIYYAFALIAEAEHHFKEAFEMSVVALFKNPKKDLLYQQSLQTAVNAAHEIIDLEVGGDIVNEFTARLEEECGKKIVIEEDALLKTAARIEFAENHNRTYHLVKYNPEYPAVHHRIMHELTHLFFAAQARREGKNKQNYTTLYEVLNGQRYNTPIDLFIEDYLFQNCPDLMPYQFLSLFGLIQEGIQAATDEKILTSASTENMSESKTCNLVHAFHFRKRYGVDLIAEHKPTDNEKEQAEKFYREYEEYRARCMPGDFCSFFEESDFRKHSDHLEHVCAEADVDFSAHDVATLPDKKMQPFSQVHQSKDINMAVTRFMVEALQYFKNLKNTEIKNIAMQIGAQYGDEISLDREGYTVPLISGKTFTGYLGVAASHDRDLQLNNFKVEAGYFIYSWLFAKLAYSDVANANVIKSSPYDVHQPTIAPALSAWLSPAVSLTGTYTYFTKERTTNAITGVTNQNTFALAVRASF